MLLKDSSAIFSGLSHDEEYFPLISSIAPQSFFGFPPTPLRPAASRKNSQAVPDTAVPTSVSDSGKGKKVEKGPSGDLSDFSEDDDDSETSSDGAGTDVSQSNTSRQSSGTSTSNGSRASSPESEGSSTDSQVPQRIFANIKLRVRKHSSPSGLCYPSS